jgi:hypothetical protein
MEPLYPMYDDDYDDSDLVYTSIQAATRLTSAAMAAGLIKAAPSTEETADQVMSFFDTAFRRIRDLGEEEDEEYLNGAEDDGEIEPL